MRKIIFRGLRIFAAFFLLFYGLFSAWLIRATVDARSPIYASASAVAGTSLLLAIGATILWMDLKS